MPMKMAYDLAGAMVGLKKVSWAHDLAVMDCLGFVNGYMLSTLR